MTTIRKKIIMVDDDITNLAIAKNDLAENYDVFTAPSGAKLFQLLEKLTPDLILLDVEMPGMNGYEVIGTLKNNKASAGIPVIFPTANLDPENEAKGLKLGAADYMVKPFSRELLLRRIGLHLLLEEAAGIIKNGGETQLDSELVSGFLEREKELTGRSI